MLKILLIEDQKLFRETLSAQLAQRADILDVLVAENGPAAVRMVTQHQPDIVLLEASMSEEYAFDIARVIRGIFSQVKMIFLSRQTFDSDVEEALSVDAKGFILETDGLPTLFQAISNVAAGGTYFSEPIRKRLSFEGEHPQLCRSSNRPALANLTPRERELLTYLGEGASLKEAAEAMAVSYKTADNQKASLMRKLDIHDRVELARFAIRQGLVSPHSSRLREHTDLLIPPKSKWPDQTTYRTDM